jgi:hypothetical protein
MRTWFRSEADDLSIISHYALVLSLALIGVIGLYFGALYLITH